MWQLFLVVWRRSTLQGALFLYQGRSLWDGYVQSLHSWWYCQDPEPNWMWTISLCCLDIANAVMTLGYYHAVPNVGHLECANQIVGYLQQYTHACIHFCTGIPDHEAICGEKPEFHDWMHFVYGSPKEQIPDNLPLPKGKPVCISVLVDANLMHGLTIGRSATGIFHLWNQIPIQYLLKCQGQVEIAIYGSEFVAFCTTME